MKEKGYKYVLTCGAISVLLLTGATHVSAAVLHDSFTEQQQSNKISGTVKDELGPIIGATVMVQDSKVQTVTDMDGKFTLDAKPGATIVISYVGYKTKIVKAGNEPLEVVMQEENKTLNEVVVTALGIKRERKALGYSVAEVKGESLTKAKETNVINTMAGRIPGLVINQTAGGASGSTRVLLRGNTEMTGNNQPLYVVDGVPLDNTNFGSAGTSGGFDPWRWHLQHQP
jgi:hypothetical protein